MKIIITLSAIVLFAFAGVASAAHFKSNNPNTVANYPTGDHGIVGEPYLHVGADVVTKSGNSGNFQQWFVGTSTENGGVSEKDHSVWKVSKDGSCSNDGWVLVENASQSWGDYLVSGANYCVKTNTSNQKPLAE